MAENITTSDMIYIYKFGFDEFKNRLKNADRMFWETVL